MEKKKIFLNHWKKNFRNFFSVPENFRILKLYHSKISCYYCSICKGVSFTNCLNCAYGYYISAAGTSQCAQLFAKCVINQTQINVLFTCELGITLIMVIIVWLSHILFKLREWLWKMWGLRSRTFINSWFIFVTFETWWWSPFFVFLSHGIQFSYLANLCALC